MRSLYAARRGYLVDALTQTMGERLNVQPQAGGIHVLASLNTRQSDRALAEAAEAGGLAVPALSRWRLRKSSRGGLLMGFRSEVRRVGKEGVRTCRSRWSQDR